MLQCAISHPSQVKWPRHRDLNLPEVRVRKQQIGIHTQESHPAPVFLSRHHTNPWENHDHTGCEVGGLCSNIVKNSPEGMVSRPCACCSRLAWEPLCQVSSPGPLPVSFMPTVLPAPTCLQCQFPLGWLLAQCLPFSLTMYFRYF